MNLEIPLGLVYVSRTLKLRKSRYHLVLSVDMEGFYEDMFKISKKGNLAIIRSDFYVNFNKFIERLQRREFSFLDEYTFEHFRDFYRVTNFIKSKLYNMYPYTRDLVRTTPQLEALVNQ